MRSPSLLERAHFLRTDGMAKPNDSERLCIELSCAVNEQRSVGDGQEARLCEFSIKLTGISFSWIVKSLLIFIRSDFYV